MNNQYMMNKDHYLDIPITQIGGAYSQIYVFNRLNDTIVRIPYDQYDQRTHSPVSDDWLVKLAADNEQNIRKVIMEKKNYKKKFFHVSTRPFEDILDTTYNNDSWLGNGIYKNPVGIWFSCGLSWQNFIGNRPNPWSLATYIYEIAISDSVLKISSVDELEQFIDRFKKKNMKIHDVINWATVKKKYDGVVVCPYLGNAIWGKYANSFSINGDLAQINNYIEHSIGADWKNNIRYTAEWYRHWEEGTGVIWRKRGLKNIHMITKLDTFDQYKRRIDIND